MVTRGKIDPITFELIKNSLASLIDEMALTMNRTAYSPLVRDLFDFATGLCDKEGNILAEGLVNPIHSGVFPLFIKTIPEVWGERIYPGDILMCNDPYEGASHIPDVYTVRPIFIDGELVAYTGAIAHQLDFGGRTAGSNACDNIEIYQEGLRIPPLKYYERGERNYTLYRLIQKNVRSSHLVIGDLEAQVAATGIGERKFVELVEKYGGWKNFHRYLDELLDYSERLTRATIRELPDGVYEFDDYMDDDGFTANPIKFHVKVVVEGDEITFDFTGTSAKSKGSINLPLSSTYATVHSAMRCLLDTSVPANSGVYRPIRIIAPYGTMVNVGFPAGVAGRGATIGRLFDAIQGALAKVAPDKIPACSSNIDFGICLGGTDEEGNPVVFTDFLAGSWGARPWADGIDANTPFWLNYSNITCERIERDYPLRIEQYGFVPETGGAGKYRGGMAMVRDYRILAEDIVCQWRQDRAKFPPWSLQGGKSGTLAKGYHISDGKERTLRKELFFCQKGDLLRAVLPGAAGYGNPYQRDVNKVLEDVRNEIITVETAKREYGVVIDPKNMQVDSKATQKLRAEAKLRKNKKSSAGV